MRSASIHQLKHEPVLWASSTTVVGIPEAESRLAVILTSRPDLLLFRYVKVVRSIHIPRSDQK